MPVSVKAALNRSNSTTSRTARSSGLLSAAVVGLSCLAICGVLVAAYYRGGDQDEYSTMYFADSTIPFSTAWKEVWPTETNPPFFYIIARLFVPITGQRLLSCRLINIIPLVFLLTWFLHTALRRPENRQFLLCLAILVFSGWYFVYFFPYYRSYCWQYCAAVVFVGAAAIGHLNRDTRPDPFQLIALPFLLILHQITALYACVLLIPLVSIDLIRRNFIRAGCLIIVSLLSSILVIYFTWLQLRQFSAVMLAVSWIEPLGPLSALRMILLNFVPSLGSNWAALLTVGLIAVVPSYRPRGPTSSLVWVIACAAIGASALVLMINQRYPLAVDYYFSFLAVEAIVVIALLITPVWTTKPWIAALIAANAGLYIMYSAAVVLHDRELLEDADMVAQLAARCPETRIHAGSRPPTLGPDPVKVIAPPESEQIALRDLAATDHLTLLPLGPDAPGICPAIYWTEYRAPNHRQIAQYGGDIAEAANEYAGFGIDQVNLGHTKAIQLRNSFAIVLVVSAPR